MASKKVAGITIELSADTTKMIKAIDNVAKQVGSAGKTLTKNVTAPIMAIGAASIAAFNEVDNGLDTIIQKTGASGSELEGMEQAFKNLAGTIPASFEDIGSAVGEVNTRFGVTGDNLEELSGQFLKFAQLNDQDVSSAIDDTQKALAAYGLDAKDASKYLDVLNKVAQNTGIDVSTLNNGIVQNSAAFQELGMSIDQAAVFMGQVEVSGADTSVVMGSLSRALKNATKQGKPLDKALDELQDTILNGTDSTDGLTEAYNLFGKSGAQVYNAVKNGTINFNELAKATISAGGSVSDTFEATLDPVDQFKIAMQNLKLAGAELGASIQGVLAPIITKLSDTIVSLTNKWKALSPETQQFIIKAAMVAAAVGPVLLVLGKVIGTVSSVIAIGSKLKVALAALSGPVGIAVAAITALVTVGVLVYKNWDTIKEKLTAVWNAIKTTAVNVWEGIKSAVMTPVNAVKSLVTGAWEGIRNATANVWNGIKNAITSPIQAAQNVVSGLVNKIKSIFPINIGNILSKIKLPHINVNWKKVGPVSIPTLSVQWYAKAMEHGMLLDGATIFGAQNGKLLGGGEAGKEWIVGQNSLLSMIKDATRQNTLSPELIYEAVRDGASAATINSYINGRNVTDTVNRTNTTIQSGALRFRGAY